MHDLFRCMFSDSEITNKFSMRSTKLAYAITFGLAPYFKSLLLTSLRNCSVFVVCFDEALNKVAQRGQMDIVIRIWNDTTNQVSSLYLTSVFLGHAKSTDLLLRFKEGLRDLQISKLIQVSMDGPTVNWKFFETLPAESHCGNRQLLELGSCGLHVVHGSLQTGHKASGWSVNATLRTMYWLFKDAPARRADFTAVTGSKKFPKKFCQVRGVENVSTCERAIEVLTMLRNTLILQRHFQVPQHVPISRRLAWNHLLL